MFIFEPPRKLLITNKIKISRTYRANNFTWTKGILKVHRQKKEAKNGEGGSGRKDR